MAVFLLAEWLTSRKLNVSLLNGRRGWRHLFFLKNLKKLKNVKDLKNELAPNPPEEAAGGRGRLGRLGGGLGPAHFLFLKIFLFFLHVLKKFKCCSKEMAVFLLAEWLASRKTTISLLQPPEPPAASSAPPI